MKKTREKSRELGVKGDGLEHGVGRKDTFELNKVRTLPFPSK